MAELKDKLVTLEALKLVSDKAIENEGNISQLSESIVENYSELKGDLAELFSVDVTWIENKYVRSANGSVVDYAEQIDIKYWASEKIEVSQFCKVSYTFAGGSNIVGCAFYNENDIYISGFGNGIVGNKISLDVPPNAKYFRYTKETKSEIGSKSDYTLYMTLVDDIGNQFALLNNSTIKMKDDKITGIADFNNIESGTIFKVLSEKTSEQLANAPVYPYKGLIITLNATREVENVKLQIATTDTNRIFMRSMWTTWSNWIEIKEYIPSFVEYGNLLGMYDNMTFIGDSLTWSQVYLTIEPKETRQAYRPYPKIVAELSGAEYEILASPGDTASQAWTRNSSKIVSKTNNINIVYLGTNGGLTDTITTDCPSDGAIDDYADTNTGCYGKILKKIYDLGQKAILIKIYDTGGDLEVTNSVIEQFGERFNFPVIGAIELGTMYRLCPIETNRTGGVHYNDLGYSVFANRFIYEVNNMNDDMKRRLIPVN